jgi:hypothetical protein
MPCRLLFGLSLVLLAIASPLAGSPQHFQTLQRYYGPHLPSSLRVCATCHAVPLEYHASGLDLEMPEHNAFGERLYELADEQPDRPARNLIDRLRQIGDEDADGDGVANELEILSGTFPADPQSKPSAEALAAATAQRREFLRQYVWRPLQPVTRPAVPDVGDATWPRTPIDQFILIEHERLGLARRPEAPRHVLLRRVYLDLIGLPPTRAELNAFLADNSPDAYEQVVERLLSDPRHGERWGRHWMDVWRYSDWAGWTGGNQIRDSQPHIWRWRDWIIESLNADRPYDQMILAMLAADELWPDDPDPLRATGYLVRNYKMLSRETWMQEAVDHTARAFLGLTIKCARCHDHFYDPIPQRAYYELRAIFEPHQVRIDRLPGQPDTAKDGLVRVYDADLNAATYLFERGDDRKPLKDIAIEPSVPAALGRAGFEIAPVALPRAAYSPDKRPFVIEETKAASAQSIEQAATALEKARQAVAQAETALAKAQEQLQSAKAAAQAAGKAADDGDEKLNSSDQPPAAPDQKQVAESLAKAEQEVARQQAALDQARQGLAMAQIDHPLAIAKHQALLATLEVEAFEDRGLKENEPQQWESLAKAALATQRAAAVEEARRNLLASEYALAAAQAALESAQQRASEKPNDAMLKEASDKAAAAKEAAAKKVQQTQTQLAAAQEAQSQPLTTAYAPRPIKSFPATSTGRRAALARWIANTQNPLTARVAVNHIWLRHFGQALVPTVFDFGNNGQPPSHPALLDWLAAELMQPSLAASRDPQGRLVWTPASSSSAPWSMKHLHRLIVTSSVYRLAASSDSANAAIDPDNTYLWRANTRRMEAEVVRDSVLYVTGELDLTRGGPDLDHTQGMKIPRRSLYFRHAAEKQMDFLKLFDVAEVSECYRRKESILPQQALALANSELTLVNARRLARQLHGENGADAGEFIAAAFEQVLARPPSTAESELCQDFLQAQREFYEQQKAALTQATTNRGDVSLPAADPALRARENLVHVLLNHNDFVTIR